jgi:hypothetical protein
MTTTPRPSRLDPEPMPRRDFLGLASLWAAAAAGLFAIVGMARLPKAAVLASPSRKFRVTLPASLPKGNRSSRRGARSRSSRTPAASTRSPPSARTSAASSSRLGAASTARATAPVRGRRHRGEGAGADGARLAPVTVSGDTCVVDEDSVVPAGTRVSA